MRAPTSARPSGSTVVASHGIYEDAQRTVDFLSDQHFPVEHTAIVGSDLRMVESVKGRMNYGKAAASGAGTGAWFGLLAGLLIALFTVTALIWPWYLLGGLVIGALFGAIFGLAAQAATGGRRDFESVSQIVPSTYDVMVADEHVGRAREMLGSSSTEQQAA